jgi:transcriptional regulator with XRE-family HTH domain
MYRKRSPLTQSDIAYLLRLPDVSNISRYEKGQRTPSIKLLLVYYLLFDVSVEKFFEHQSDEIKVDLEKQIEGLINDLTKGPDPGGNSARIEFLRQVIIRITR